MKDRLDFVPSHVTGLLGLCGCLAGAWWLRFDGVMESLVHGAIGLLVLAAVPMLLWDTLVERVYQNPSTGLAVAAPPTPSSWGRVATKLLGLGATLATVALVYWLFPEYHGGFYKPFWELCRWGVPLTLVLALVYVPWVDRRQVNPEDAYYHMGLLASGRWRRVDWRKLEQHGFGWLIKGFFLPLMFIYLTRDVKYIQTHAWVHPWVDFGLFFDWMYNFIFTVDLVFVVTGYTLTLRLFDAHIRRPETTALGWGSALLCYQPFWSTIEQHYLSYGTDFAWGAWLKPWPPLYMAWGTVLLLVLAGFGWATVVFGVRFSNLTHRGVIAFGPYAFTKHPAYVTKLVSFALISIPFVPESWTWTDAVDCGRRCALLGLLAFVYWVRGRTEETNLSHDPAYRVYARWMRMRHARWFGRPLRRLLGRA